MHGLCGSHLAKAMTAMEEVPTPSCRNAERFVDRGRVVTAPAASASTAEQLRESGKNAERRWMIASTAGALLRACRWAVDYSL